ncbi:MAG: hypothetical protein JWL79_589 [Frankiales bacterium]|nr:hypothetical protein [Frankiales bacterium]
MGGRRGTDGEVLDRLADYDREDAHRIAARALDLVELERYAKGSTRSEFLLLEVATTCNISQQSAAIRMAQAHRLVDELPNTLFRLHTRQLSVGQGLAVLEETAQVAVGLLGAVEARVYPAVVGMTPAETRRHVKAVVAAVDHEAAERRRQRKRAERRTWVSDRGDGRVLGGIEMSAEDGVLWHDALAELVRLVFPAGEHRTVDQQRADVAALLPQVLLETRPGMSPVQVLKRLLGLPVDVDGAVDGAGERLLARVRRRVQAVVTVPVQTGLDLTDQPGELRGYGPVTAGHCRELLAAADLRKACVALSTGRLVALEDTLVPGPAGQVEQTLLAMVARSTDVESRVEEQHDPSAGLTDFIRLRDPRCVGPSCSQPAHVCDSEHATPHPTGPTAATNLAPVSRRCHNSKSWGGWTLTPHPDGSVTWTSPLGRAYTRPPRHQPPDLTTLQMPWTRHVAAVESTSSDGDEAAPPVDPDDLPF